MSIFNSKFSLFLISLVIGILVQACASPKCEHRDFLLDVRFIDGVVDVRKHFDRVYDPSLSMNWIENDFLDSIPVDLSKDTTFFILENEDEIDTLKFSYKRSLETGNHSHAYCMTIKNPRIEAETTWEWVFIIFETSFWGSSRDNPYEIEIRL